MRTNLIIILLLLTISCLSQSNNDKAKVAFLNASDEYDNAKYTECITSLKSAISFLNTTNIRIQYLISKSYFQLKDYQQAKIEIEGYFSFNPPVDDSYREIMDISQQIDKIIQQQQETEKKRQAELASWIVTQSKNTIEAYQQYIHIYPNGSHANEAISNIDEISWNEASKSNTIESYKKYLFDLPSGTNAGKAKKLIKDYEREFDMKNQPDKYFVDACLKMDVNLIKKLVEYGANCSVTIKQLEETRTYINYSPITYIIHSSYPKTDWDSKVMLSILFLLHGADVSEMVERSMRDPNNGWDKYVGEWLVNEITEENQNYIFDILKKYIVMGMNVNQDKGSPLRALVQRHSSSVNCYKMIEYMLSKGANSHLEKPWHTSNSGGISGKYHSPFRIAKKKGKKDLVELFKKYKRNH